jgi:hypothetical protein
MIYLWFSAVLLCSVVFLGSLLAAPFRSVRLIAQSAALLSAMGAVVSFFLFGLTSDWQDRLQNVAALKDRQIAEQVSAAGATQPSERAPGTEEEVTRRSIATGGSTQQEKRKQADGVRRDSERAEATTHESKKRQVEIAPTQPPPKMEKAAQEQEQKQVEANTVHRDTKQPSADTVAQHQELHVEVGDLRLDTEQAHAATDAATQTRKRQAHSSPVRQSTKTQALIEQRERIEASGGLRQNPERAGVGSLGAKEHQTQTQIVPRISARQPHQETRSMMLSDVEPAELQSNHITKCERVSPSVINCRDISTKELSAADLGLHEAKARLDMVSDFVEKGILDKHGIVGR